MGSWAKQARTALGQKDYNQAGDFYKLDGDYRAAIKAYLKGNNYVEAAKIYESMGKIKKAEKILYKHGDPKDLAEYHLRQGNPSRATAVYLQNGMKYEAAELYERQHQLASAAEIYGELRFFERAGLLFSKAKHFDSAIEMFTRAIRQMETDEHSNAPPKTLKYKDWIANLHIGAKRFNQAGEIFEEIQQREKAAKCYVKGGALLKAAELLIQMSEHDRAKAILETVDSREARILLGRIAMVKKEYEEAVKYLTDTDHYQSLAEAHEHLGEFEQAGRAFEKMGDLPKAAAMYSKAHDHQRAALIYEQNGLYEEAAQNYEKQKKYGHAAKLYHMAKNRFKAGQCLYRLNRLEDALKQLQLVEDDHPQFQQSKTIMAEIFFKQGVYSVSRRLLEEITSGSTLNDTTMSIFYLLARCLEEEGDLPAARAYYDRIMARRFDYLDVSKRLRHLLNTATASDTLTYTNKTEHKSALDVGEGDVIAERFKILSTIGKGGMGYIFKVRDLQLDRDIALKMLIGERANFEELKGELLIARDLTHPYIIKVFDVGQWNNTGYFTMEYVEGQPLKAYIKKNQDSVDRKVRFLIKVCEGLKHAHDQGVVHRDIKPQNILLDGAFNPKILDFGIARKVTQGAKIGAISGSPKYMAPEQIQNLHTDLRTDIYAMGIIMFYMFTRQEPFVAKTPQEVMLMHLQHNLPDPFEIDSTLPFWLCDIIRKCCQKNPDLRFGDMRELVDELSLNLMDLTG